jgi:multidrug transporter EmrE-like cation transporter
MKTYLYLTATIILTVYGQVILKWRISKMGPLPEALTEKLFFLFSALLDPFIFSGLILLFVASICWMVVVAKLDLSYAYPFVSLSFVAVLLLSGLFFSEPITWQKSMGMVLIVAGVSLSAQSM